MPSGRAPGYYLCLLVVPDFTPYGAWGKVSKTVTDLVSVVDRLSLFNVWVLSPQVCPVYFNVFTRFSRDTSPVCIRSVYKGVT